MTISRRFTTKLKPASFPMPPPRLVATQVTFPMSKSRPAFHNRPSRLNNNTSSTNLTLEILGYNSPKNTRRHSFGSISMSNTFVGLILFTQAMFRHRMSLTSVSAGSGLSFSLSVPNCQGSPVVNGTLCGTRMTMGYTWIDSSPLQHSPQLEDATSRNKKFQKHNKKLFGSPYGRTSCLFIYKTVVHFLCYYFFPPAWRRRIFLVLLIKRRVVRLASF